MTLRAYLRILGERWRLVALMVVLSTGVAVLITGLTPKTYQADVQIFVSTNGDTSSQTGQYDGQAAAQSYVTTFADLIDSPTVIAGVRNDLNLNLSDDALKSRLSATAPATQTLVIIHATDGSPALAASIANSAGKVFVSYIQELKTPTDSKKSAVKLSVTSQATAPDSPISPNVVLNVALGLFLGLLIGAALAVARDLLDNRIKDVDSFARTAGRPAMGIVVDDPDVEKHPIAAKVGSRSVRAENFRQLRANLQFANVDAHPRVIAITSSIPAEGKTMVAMNLASTLAEAGFTVCLIDADLRRPTVAKVLGLPSAVGLTSVLISQIELGDALQEAGPNFFVLSSGPIPPNPSEVLASTYMRDIVHQLLDRVDYVLIDTAPLLPVADGSEVAALADGTLLVARRKLTTDVQVKRAVTLLSQVDATLLGVVLNRVPMKRSGEYGYTYYRADAKDDPSAKSILESGGRRRPAKVSAKVSAKHGKAEEKDTANAS